MSEHDCSIADVFEPLNAVLICEPKPNPMFDEWQHRNTRFLIFKKPVKCVACGKKRKRMWTLLWEFRAANMEDGLPVMQYYPQVFAPLTPVCVAHPIGPAIEQDQEVSPA